MYTFDISNFDIWSNRIHRLKYKRSMTLCCKDIEIRKQEFVANTQFLCLNFALLTNLKGLFYFIFIVLKFTGCYAFTWKKKFFNKIWSKWKFNMQKQDRLTLETICKQDRLTLETMITFQFLSFRLAFMKFGFFFSKK